MLSSFNKAEILSDISPSIEKIFWLTSFSDGPSIDYNVSSWIVGAVIAFNVSKACFWSSCPCLITSVCFFCRFVIGAYCSAKS